MHARTEAKLFHHGNRNVCCLILRIEFFFNQLHLYRIIYNLKSSLFNFFRFAMLAKFVRRTYSCRICLKTPSWSISFYSLMFFYLLTNLYIFQNTLLGSQQLLIHLRYQYFQLRTTQLVYSTLFFECHIAPKNCVIFLIYLILLVLQIIEKLCLSIFFQLGYTKHH